MSRVDRELSSELIKSPINPAFLHMSTPWKGYDLTFHLQINGETLWQWRDIKSHIKYSTFFNLTCFKLAINPRPVVRISKSRSRKRARQGLDCEPNDEVQASDPSIALAIRQRFFKKPVLGKIFWPSCFNHCESNESNRKKSCCTQNKML